MSTPNEDRQKETDRQAGLHYQRVIDRARFGSPLAADLFEFGVEMNRTVAAFCQSEGLTPLEIARRNAAAESDEIFSEGRLHRNTRPDKNGP